MTSPALVRDAGFRAGDVITRVNGQKVGDISVDQRYFDDVVLSGRARVEVLRDGQSIILSFPLR
jgi:general secretion pathway protein C